MGESVFRWSLSAALVVGGLGACSAAEPPPAAAPTIASLVTVSPSASGPAAAKAKVERPRHRLDETAADLAALNKAFDKCMGEHGVDSQGSFMAGDDVPPELDAAQDACLPFWPLPAWELDPANPAAKDFAHDVVACLRAKGVKHVTVGENGTGIEAGDDSVTATGNHLDECQREVARKN
ncbi:hypothetical protein [Actinoplanes palleronii]|uniref:Secreted protein n=1 Tax=Actinoplanes palleronii TaxID=113570 RepID=A0ABQ4BKI8_9ACTN|nr:hypothetical protein [Actinoplanes palleronii]GIE71142.1 hypothetical protein Apa02nite_072500 [Actinoplanes palleronii]